MKSIKKAFAVLLAVLTFFFALPLNAQAASLKPAASGMNASFKSVVYNDEKLVITITLSGISLCDTVTVTVGNQSKTVKPTLKKLPIRQTATITFPAYSFDPGKYTVKLTAKNTAGVTTKNIGTITIKNTYSVSGKVLTVKGVRMSEYEIGGKYSSTRYAKINGRNVDMAAWECYGFSRYLQSKLYGRNSGTSYSYFSKLSGSRNVYLRGAALKTLIQRAGIGAHIRTASGHSMTVIGISSTGFVIADANANLKNTIRTKPYTYNNFCSNWGTIAFIEVF